MATQALTLDKDAFAALVTEHKLQTTEADGYIYTGKQGKHGWELYKVQIGRSSTWVYTQVCTQDNGAGGNLQVNITPAAGTRLKLVIASIQASGNRATGWYLLKATDTYVVLAAAGASAGGKSSIPALASSAATTGNLPEQYGLVEHGIPEDLAYVGLVTAAAQTETATVRVYAVVEGASTAPTVSWAASGGTPNAAAASVNSLREFRA